MHIKGHIEHGTSPCILLSNQKYQEHFIIDTGFDGELCLNLNVLHKWGFQLKGTQEVELADGRIVLSRIYTGRISWFGEKKHVLANETKSQDCLLGTALLWGVHLELDIAAGKVLLSKNKKGRK